MGFTIVTGMMSGLFREGVALAPPLVDPSVPVDYGLAMRERGGAGLLEGPADGGRPPGPDCWGDAVVARGPDALGQGEMRPFCGLRKPDCSDAGWACDPPLVAGNAAFHA